MPSFKISTLALFSGLLAQQSYAQSNDWTFNIGGDSSCQGLSNGGHCCPGSVIGAGSSSATCCVGDPNFNLINTQGSVNLISGAINGNGINGANELKGASTCTAGTSTAFNALPSTGSASPSATGNGSGSGSGTGTASSSASTTTTTNGSQVCITVKNGGQISQTCHGTGSSGDSSSQSSGNGNTVMSGASSGGSSNSESSSSTSSHNGATAATAAPMLAGALLGIAALL